MTNPWEITYRTDSPAPSTYSFYEYGYWGDLPRVGTSNPVPPILTYEESGIPGRLFWTSYSVWVAHYSGRVYKYVQEYDVLTVNAAVIEDSYEYSYSTTQAETYTEKNNRLGAGWSWNLPSIEIASGVRTLHLGDGRSYVVQSNPGLKDYTLTDLKLEADAGTYSNGQATSAYVLKEKDGYKTYFASDGRALGRMDRYGNTIQYKHTTIGGRAVVNQIVDTTGRQVNIAYNNTPSGKEVVITSPDSTETRLILESIPGYSTDYVLRRIVNPNQAETSFNYSYAEARFDFVSKNPASGVSNRCANLVEVLICLALA